MGHKLGNLFLYGPVANKELVAGGQVGYLKDNFHDLDLLANYD